MFVVPTTSTSPTKTDLDFCPKVDEVAGRLPDGLHPDLEGNRIMGNRFVDLYQQLDLPGAPALQSRTYRIK